MIGETVWSSYFKFWVIRHEHIGFSRRTYWTVVYSPVPSTFHKPRWDSSHLMQSSILLIWTGYAWKVNLATVRRIFYFTWSICCTGTILIYGDTYTGEFDRNSKACGEGVLVWSNGTVKKGTWKNNKLHGYGNIFFQHPKGERIVGEWKEGKKHGLLTRYSGDGSIANV